MPILDKIYIQQYQARTFILISLFLLLIQSMYYDGKYRDYLSKDRKIANNSNQSSNSALTFHFSNSNKQFQTINQTAKNIPKTNQFANKRQSQNLFKRDYSRIYSQTMKNNESKSIQNGYSNYFINQRQQLIRKTEKIISYQHKESPILSSGYKNNNGLYKFNTQKHIRNEGRNQYEKLYDKLNLLQNKIEEMKSNIQSKRQEKRKFLQHQHNQYKKIIEQSKQNSENILSKSKYSKNNGALKNFVTQVPQHKQLNNFKFNPYSPHHNTYYVSEIARAFKQDRSIARDHIQSSLNILKMLQNVRVPNMEQIRQRKLNLQKKPGYHDKKTLIFDLDETLIHCNQSTNIPHDVKLSIQFANGETLQAGVNIRPYARQLLENLYKKFQLIIFTASHQSYANVVINHLDPQKKYIQHRLYRQHCIQTPHKVYVKDLRIINRDPSQMVLIDNAAYSYAFQLDNGVPIIPYYEGKYDFELKALEGYLNSLLLSKDMRQQNRKIFKLHQYINYNQVNKLVKQLYKEQFK